MIAPGIRVLAALRGGAVLVARPRGVVHVYPGHLTRTGRAVPGSARPFCGTRSRRLRVVGRAGSLPSFPGAGRRFCRSCTDRLPAALGVDGRSALVSRDDFLTAYAALTVQDLMVATSWCRTVEETHQVGHLVLILFGPKPLRPATSDELQLREVHDAIEHRRHALRDAELTDDERAARAANREAKAFEAARIQSARRSAAALDKAMDRRLRGQYLMPHERDLLQSST
jgi:hypothetical protein